MPAVLLGSGGRGALTLELHSASDFSSLFQVLSSNFSMSCATAVALCFAATPRAVSFKSTLSVFNVLSKAPSSSVQGSGVGSRDILRCTAMCCSLLLEDGILHAFHLHVSSHSGMRNFSSLAWLTNTSRAFTLFASRSVSMCFSRTDFFFSILANFDLQTVRALVLKKSSAFKYCPPVAKNICPSALAFWMTLTLAVELVTVMAWKCLSHGSMCLQLIPSASVWSQEVTTTVVPAFEIRQQQFTLIFWASLHSVNLLPNTLKLQWETC